MTTRPGPSCLGITWLNDQPPTIPRHSSYWRNDALPGSVVNQWCFRSQQHHGIVDKATLPRPQPQPHDPRLSSPEGPSSLHFLPFVGQNRDQDFLTSILCGIYQNPKCKNPCELSSESLVQHDTSATRSSWTPIRLQYRSLHSEPAPPPPLFPAKAPSTFESHTVSEHPLCPFSMFFPRPPSPGLSFPRLPESLNGHKGNLEET